MRWAKLLLCGALALSLVGCGFRREGRVGVGLRRTPASPFVTGASPAAGDVVEQLVTPDGRTRQYIVHVPSPRPSGQLPLVLLFHGGDGTAAGMERIAHFDAVADEHGILAVYPEGYQKSWNDGAGNAPAEVAGVDDVAFVSALLDRLESDFPVDVGRVAAGGLSNGGLFSELLGCALAGRLAVIEPVAAPLPAAIAPNCRPARPVSILAIHGTDDPLVLYQGGQGRGFGGGAVVLSAQDSIAEWARLDGCSPGSSTSSLPDRAKDGTTVNVTAFAGCTGGAAVQLYTVHGGGHTWPGGEQYAPASLVGVTTQQFDAGELLWTFLAAHPSP